VTVTFVEQNGKTILTIRTLLTSAAQLKAVVEAGVEPGWASTLERLAEHLAVA